MAKETEILEYLIRVETELGKAKDAANALGNVDKETKKVEKSLDRTEKQTKKTSAAMQTLQRTVVGLVGIHALKGLATDATRTALAFESMDRKMKAATGSAASGRREMEFVRREAQRLGKDVLSLGDSYASLTAAAKGTALEGANTQKVFTAVAEATTVLGLTSADTEGVLRALQQMMSKGTVAAEELREQLGERLPGAFQIAARSMGVTTRELGKMLENGEVIADDFLPKFAAELSKTFGPQVASAMDSHAATLARIRNLWTETSAALGGYILTGIDPYLRRINEMVAAHRELKAATAGLTPEQALDLADSNSSLAGSIRADLQGRASQGDAEAARNLQKLNTLEKQQYYYDTVPARTTGAGASMRTTNAQRIRRADPQSTLAFRDFLKDQHAQITGISQGGGGETATPQQPVIEATQKAIDLQQKLTLATLSGFDQQRKAASYLFEERASQIDDLFSKKQIDEDKRRQLNQLNVDAHRLKNEQIEEAEREHQERLKQIREDASEEEVRRIRLTSEQIENIRTESEEMFAAGMTDALLSFVDGTEKAEDAFKKFASSFLREIARMIIQQQILNAVRAASSYLSFADGGTSTLADGGVRYAAAGMTSAARPTYNARHNVIYGEAGREMLAVLARPRTMSIGGASAVVGRVGGSRVAMMNANDLPTMAANGAINGDGVPRAGAAGGGGFGGNGVLVIRLEEGLKAEMAEAGGMRGLQIVTEHMGTHSKLRSATHKVAKAG